LKAIAVKEKMWIEGPNSEEMW